MPRSRDRGIFYWAVIDLFLFVGYISIAAVTATCGFALTASPFGKRPKRNQKVSPRASGPSPWLGVPPLRHSSVGIALRLASLAPTCDEFGCVERRCVPIPSTQPPEGRVGQDQKPKQSERNPVGTSLLAKNVQTPRSSRQPASSLTSIASKLAPTILAA